eukprot:m.290327 g.290327  ORF g.290327 m.290327 type:complete len:61 (-) comp210514_c0_seq1:114-296(-)
MSLLEITFRELVELLLISSFSHFGFPLNKKENNFELTFKKQSQQHPNDDTTNTLTKRHQH